MPDILEIQNLEEDVLEIDLNDGRILEEDVLEIDLNDGRIMPDILEIQILEEDVLEIDLNDGRVDPYIQIENIEVIESPRTVDTEMSNISENPVQNKVIKAYVDSMSGDKHYTHTQIAASNTWLVKHNLDKFPAVMIVDSGNSKVTGDIEYLTANTLQIKFSTAFSGKVYCN